MYCAQLVQRQTVVTDYLKNNQLLLFAFSVCLRYLLLQTAATAYLKKTVTAVFFPHLS